MRMGMKNVERVWMTSFATKTKRRLSSISKDTWKAWEILKSINSHQSQKDQCKNNTLSKNALKNSARKTFRKLLIKGYSSTHTVTIYTWEFYQKMQNNITKVFSVKTVKQSEPHIESSTICSNSREAEMMIAFTMTKYILLSKRDSFKLVSYYLLSAWKVNIASIAFCWSFKLKFHLFLCSWCFNWRVVRVNSAISLFELGLRFIKSFHLFTCILLMLFKSFIYLWDKGTLLEILIHLIFLLFQHFLDFVLLPNVHPLQKSWIAISEIPFIITKYRLKSAFNVEPILTLFVLLR